MGVRPRHLLYGAALVYAAAVLAVYSSGYDTLATAPQFISFIFRAIGIRLLFVLALSLSAFGACGLVFGRWLPRFSNLIEEGVFKTTLGLVIISYALFALGHAGLIYPATGWLVLAAGIAAGWRAIPDYIKRAYHAAPRTVGVTSAAVILVPLSAYFLISGLYGSLLPPIGFDVLMYHLGAPRLYIDAHRIFPTPDINGSFFPFGVEMLYMLGMMVDGPISANLVNFSFAVLGGLTAAMFTRRFVKADSGWLSFSMFISIPLIAWLMPQAYIEFALAAYCMLAMYALFASFTEDDNGWLIVAGVMAGFTMATKYTGIPVVLALVIVAKYQYLFIEKVGVRVTTRRLCIYLAVAAVVCLPWYVRNLFFYGNPVYPYLAGVFGQATVSGVSGSPNEFFGAGVASGLVKLVASLWRATFDGASFKMGAINGFGPVFVMFIPGVLLFKGIEREIKYLLLISLGLYLVLISLDANIRYTAPILPAMAVLAAYPAGRLMRSDEARERMLGLAMVVVFAFGALLANTSRDTVEHFPGANKAAEEKYYSEGPWSGYLASYDAWNWINSELPADAVIYQLWDDASVYFRGRKTIGSALPWGEHGRQKLHIIDGYNHFGGYLAGQEMVSNLHQMGAGYLLINANREGHALPEDPYFLAGAELLYGEKGVFLYRLR